MLPFLLKIIIGLYQTTFSSSISFDLDTVYLKWNTTFPAVTVCEVYNGEKMWDMGEMYYGVDHDLRLDDFIGEIVYFRGTCSTCYQCEPTICPSNFTHLSSLFRTKCRDLVVNCSYGSRYFDCCDLFLPIKTEYGICYAFNSNQARQSSMIQFANNRLTGPGLLMFSTAADVQIHIHSPLEIPYLFSDDVIRETLLLGTFKEIILNVNEVFNHESVYPITPEERHCRFPTEKTKLGLEFELYEFYSFSACTVECMIAIHIESCNCTSPIFAASDIQEVSVPTCDVAGLICLTEKYYHMLQQRKDCDCISSCEEPEYNIVYNSADDENIDESELTDVKISLIGLPTERYIRRVAKNNLDTLIAVGGIAGLFFNASIIRVFELIYFLSHIRNKIKSCQLGKKI